MAKGVACTMHNSVWSPCTAQAAEAVVLRMPDSNRLSMGGRKRCAGMDCAGGEAGQAGAGGRLPVTLVYRLWHKLPPLVRRGLAWPYLPFVLLFALFLAWHLQLQLVDVDEAYYREIFLQRSIPDFVVSQYKTWSARTLIELGFGLFCALPPLAWRLCNPVVITVCALCISRLIGAAGKAGVNWMLCALLVLYTWRDLSSAGWIITTLAYLWPCCALLVALLPVADFACGRRPRWWQCVLSLPLALYAANMEQANVVLLVLLFALLCWCVARRRMPHWVVFGQLAMCGANLLYTFLSPGVDYRFTGEAISWYPDFGMKPLLSRLELGLSSALNPLVYGRDMLFDGFCLLLMLAIWAQHRGLWRRLLAVVPLGVSLLFGYGMRLLPGLAFFTEALRHNGTIDLMNARQPVAYLPMALLYLVFVVIVAYLYLAFGHNTHSFAAIAVLAAGVASRVVIGFSPTVWSSGGRTAFFMMMAFVVLGAMLYRQLRTSGGWQRLAAWLGIGLLVCLRLPWLM